LPPGRSSPAPLRPRPRPPTCRLVLRPCRRLCTRCGASRTTQAASWRAWKRQRTRGGGRSTGAGLSATRRSPRARPPATARAPLVGRPIAAAARPSTSAEVRVKQRCSMQLISAPGLWGNAVVVTRLFLLLVLVFFSFACNSLWSGPYVDVYSLRFVPP